MKNTYVNEEILKSEKIQNYIYAIIALCFGGSKLKEEIQILNGCNKKVEC